MPELRGIRLGVVCDRTTLQEFSVTKGNDNRSISCFIPSEAGKTFHLLIGNTLPEDAIAGKLSVDGRVLESFLCASGTSRLCIGVTINEHEIKPFQFSVVQTTDDDTVAQPGDPISQQLGTMEVRFRRCRINPKSTASIVTSEIPTFGAVHERSKKAGVHRVSLGDGIRPRRPLTRCNVDYVDTREEPYAIFTFRYKPQDVLIAQGVMPHPARTNEQVSEDARPRKKQRTSQHAGDSDSGVELVPGSDDEDPELETMKKQVAQLQKRMARRIAAKRTKKQLGRAIKQEMLKEEEPNDAVIMAESSIIDLTSD
ncbi:hypothetical protein CERSUDRAFT_110952 [Gelatoporia subvermispora B]|uniref:DUF7918 domain-containing protein n=1 Tax=Ceriporiopsis subvermispora (strain B) TaxID=914234 RepID=M2QTI3_CERS8|nr:hypothetical protein CERSUDRAFT_110952 [Gelatoporia subvermispora B]